MNELTRLAVDVNDILGRYISLHNEIFKFSLRKIILTCPQEWYHILC